ncbi:MAG: hypothetical protein JWM99_565 [Verrucomicrobiales bacterium]|nr:hypothetical protein [Verrucomicrobiales bacterium]
MIPLRSFTLMDRLGMLIQLETNDSKADDLEVTPNPGALAASGNARATLP